MLTPAKQTNLEPFLARAERDAASGFQVGKLLFLIFAKRALMSRADVAEQVDGFLA